MTKKITNLLKIMFIIMVGIFSFQVSSTEIQAETAFQKSGDCKITMGSVRFLGCWGSTEQFCKSKGDCGDELEHILK